ncbi:hypothetical protein ACFYZ4_03880 [Streptomyces sp. NPDC001513]|uniref:hypothetical protein n=1 Tax=Streptomyces sp. NPDC001513 TaxID=3364580 RepID=UPI0036804537
MTSEDGTIATVPHRLLHKQVREIGTLRGGVLMDVLSQTTGFVDGRHRYADVAYVRGANGREFTVNPSMLEEA